MTAIELSIQIDKTPQAITKWCSRNGHRGIGVHDELPQAAIDKYLGTPKTDPPQEQEEEITSELKEVIDEPKIEKPKAPKVKTVKEEEPEEPEPGTEEPEVIKRFDLEEANNPEPSQPAYANTKQFDLGDWIFFHPTAQFIAVTILISCGAYVFGRLANKCFPDEINAFTQSMFYAAGFLVTASGIVVSKKYKRKNKWDEAGGVWFYLIVLFLVEIAIEYSYMFYKSDFSWPGLVVVIVRPLALLAYSWLYLNSSVDSVKKNVTG